MRPASATDDDPPAPRTDELGCTPGQGGTSGAVIGCMDVFGFPLPDYSQWCGYDYLTPGCGGATLDSDGGGPGLVVLDYIKQAPSRV